MSIANVTMNSTKFYEPDPVFVYINEHVPRNLFGDASKNFNYSDNSYRFGLLLVALVPMVLGVIVEVLLLIGQARRFCFIPRGSVSAWLRVCLLLCCAGLTVTAVCEVLLHRVIRIEERTGFNVSNNEEINDFMTSKIFPMVERQNIRLKTIYRRNPWGRRLFNVTAFEDRRSNIDVSKKAIFGDWKVTREVHKFTTEANYIINSLYNDTKQYPVQSVYTNILRALERIHYLTIMLLACFGILIALISSIYHPYVMAIVLAVTCCNIIASVQSVALVACADACVEPHDSFLSITSTELDNINKKLLEKDYKRACLQWYLDFEEALGKIKKPLLLSRIYAWKSEALVKAPYPLDFKAEYHHFMFLQAVECYMDYDRTVAPPLKSRCLNSSDTQSYDFIMDSVCDVNNIWLLIIQVAALLSAVILTTLTLLLAICCIKPKKVCMSHICSEFFNKKVELLDERPNICIRMSLGIYSFICEIVYLLCCGFLIDWFINGRRRRFLRELTKHPQDSEEYQEKLEEFRLYLTRDPGIIEKYPHIFVKHPQLLELVFERNPKLLEKHLKLLSAHPEVLQRLLIKHPKLLQKYPKLLTQYPELLEYYKALFDIPEDPPFLDKSIKQPTYSLERFTCSRWVCKDNHPCGSESVCEDPWTCPGVSPKLLPRPPEFPLPPGESDATSSKKKKSKMESELQKRLKFMPSPKILIKHIPCGNKKCIKKKRCVCKRKDPTVLLKDSEPSPAVVKFDATGRLRAPYRLMKASEMEKELQRRKREECKLKLRQSAKEQREKMEESWSDIKIKLACKPKTAGSRRASDPNKRRVADAQSREDVTNRVDHNAKEKQD